jgi:mono/diheme cytochrome c family protein
MPRWMYYALTGLFVLSLVPLAFIAKARSGRSTEPRIHIIPDMDNQDRFEAQAGNATFADGRAMRPPIQGTVPFQGAPIDEGLHFGSTSKLMEPEDADGASEEPAVLAYEELPVHSFPMPVTEAMLERGQERFEIFCAPCHGLSGYGDGMIDKRAADLQEATWTIPSNLHDKPLRAKPVGYLYQVVSNGVRSMPAYGPQIPVEDRWAIVAYLEALQRSQDGTIDDVPAEQRDQIRAE